METVLDVLLISILLVSLSFNLQTVATLEDREWRRLRWRIRNLVRVLRKDRRVG
jgi:hypothetical protein